MTKIQPLAITLAMLALIFSSCSKDEEKSNESYFASVSCIEANDTLNTYSGKIGTILSSNCALGGCHNATSHEDGKDFSTYSTSVSGFNNVLCTINYDGCEEMPRSAAKLSDADIHDLTCWAKNDFPE